MIGIKGMVTKPGECEHCPFGIVTTDFKDKCRTVYCFLLKERAYFGDDYLEECPLVEFRDDQYFYEHYINNIKDTNE